MNKKKKNYKNTLILIITILCTISFTISFINVINWNINKNKINKEINEINKITDIKETKDNNNTEIIIQEKQIENTDPYWDYIKMNLIDVDFNNLIQKNNDTKGWIKLNGTNINYPFVQTNDNKYYLTHSFDKSYNKAGWVFLDYRNNINTLDKNTILYAHGRTDSTMFGTLRTIFKSNWFDDKNNYAIKLSTEKENTLWQVFSVYIITTTNDYIQTNFNSEDEFLDWSNKLLNRSSYNFNTSINKNDKILTLSTCYNEKKKVVMHAKLIKKEAR